MRSTFALVAALVLAGCAGTVPAGAQTALAAGQTLRLDFHERVCHSTHDSRGMGEFNKTRDAWYTAPPTQFSFGCSISVFDPLTHASANPGA